MTIYMFPMSAIYDGEVVAIKFFIDESIMRREQSVYLALNATRNPKIEEKGIPNLYANGEMFRCDPYIAMTLFEESLHSRWEFQNKTFEIYSTLYVFLQSVRTLSYIHNKGVVHNDIKPQNIFLRKNEVFIG
ncbi:probable casein kinase I homolog ECU03_0910, partial [Contarinia nasturtii]|uniref:probable casein kinase I homolog ECU03_0910 n=1 Tax=Contarinia nasturtii TaxID=265458 RepID=UPI0012D37CA5